MSLTLNQVTAVVLAGGYGTRVRHLLPGVPKPMAPVAGRPFLEWVVRYLAKQGVRRVVLSTGYLSEVIEEHFSKHPISGVKVTCAVEQTPLGTGGGFLHSVRASGDQSPAWLILNGDTAAFGNLAAAAALLDDPHTGGVILGRTVTDTSRYGTLVCGPGGELLRFEEKRPGSGVISTGVYLLRDSLLARFPDKLPLSLEAEVFPALTSPPGLLRVQLMQAPFLDIGTPETLPQAESFIRQNLQEFSL